MIELILLLSDWNQSQLDRMLLVIYTHVKVMSVKNMLTQRYWMNVLMKNSDRTSSCKVSVNALILTLLFLW